MYSLLVFIFVTLGPYDSILLELRKAILSFIKDSVWKYFEALHFFHQRYNIEHLFRPFLSLFEYRLSFFACLKAAPIILLTEGAVEVKEIFETISKVLCYREWYLSGSPDFFVDVPDVLLLE